MQYRVLLAAMLLVFSAPVFAQYTINMRDADVRAFADDAARVTGLTMVVDGRVNQKVSVVTQRPLSRSEYVEVFLSTLRANGLVAIPIRGGYRIQPLEGAATQATRVTSNSRSRNQFVSSIARAARKSFSSINPGRLKRSRSALSRHRLPLHQEGQAASR